MRTKNTHELRLRANAHARAGHVDKGTYGKAKINGHADYRGCAIACLAAPHRKRDLRRWLKALTNPFPDYPGWTMLESEQGQLHRDSLQKEFGLCGALISVVEGVFEAQPTHAEAIDFVRDFAHAVPEGVRISPREVRRFLESRGVPAFSLEDPEDAWMTIRREICRPNGSELGIAGSVYARRSREFARARAFTEEFLEWLRLRRPSGPTR